MNTANVLDHFRRIGASLKIHAAQPPSGNLAFWWEPPANPRLEVGLDGTFILTVPTNDCDKLEIHTLLLRDCNGGSLALVVHSGEYSSIHRFLCGSDREDGWFVAPLANVASASHAA